MPVTLNDVQQLLIENKILDARSLQQSLSHLQASKNTVTVEDFATALVHEGALTHYQARAIYHGKGKALILNNYLVLDKIGVGGMGRIYRARHRRMDRIVALKILPPELVNQQNVVHRFQREVTAAARLHHPNIVMAFDADCAKGVHFMVMEYVDGIDLSALVKQHGTISVERAVDYIRQAACGLQYAHLKNVIHRDVKPGNLMVDSSETVKILDMGLVLLKDSIRNSSIINLTKTNVIMGTVDFMSPEQALNSKYVDERGDIYSLGMTLYYLLVGKPAYGGATAVERLLAHRDAPLPSLMAERSDVDSRLDSVFQSMVAKKPDDRYQSMAEVIDALTSYTAGTKAGALRDSDSLAEDDKLNAFLLSLERNPVVVPRGKEKNASETVEAPSTNIDRSKKPLKFELSSDQESILERQLIDRRKNAPGVNPPRKIHKAYAVLGVLAVLVILALLYQLGKAQNAANRPSGPVSPNSTEIDFDERTDSKPKGNDREARDTDGASDSI